MARTAIGTDGGIPDGMALRTALVVAALASSLAATRPAHADDAELPPGLTTPIAARPVELAPPAPIDEKSPALAFALGFGTTLGGYVLMAHAGEHGAVATLGFAGALVGPSVGQWYAGKRAWAGTAARGLGAGLVIYGMMTSLVAGDCVDCGTHPRDDRAELYLIAGAALWVGSTIYDIVDGAFEASAVNRRQRALTFAPTLMPAPTTGAPMPGLAASLRF